MSRYNRPNVQPLAPVMTAGSPLRTSSAGVPDARTFEGAAAWNRDKRTDLFLRAASSFHDGKGNFYESAETRDDTLRQLVRQLAVEDFTWLCRFAQWLRGPGNIRTAALMIAVDAVKARLEVGGEGCTGADVPHPDAEQFIPTNRWLISAVCQRSDEPGELLAYWHQAYGRKVPKPVKRGLADAAQRLYNERSLLKYDTASHGIRFADVLELCHPSPADDKKAWQGDLFKYAIDRRHGREGEIPESLKMVQYNADLRARTDPADWLYPENLRNAGMTWEDALSAVGSKVDKAKLWEAMIPNMGYMALLRNLRNFDEAGVSDAIADSICGRLKDPVQVANSRQLPFRFYSAYKHAPSLRWGHALETALDLCLPNIPTFTGRTLVLVDTSASMNNPMSGKSQMQCVEAAALFGSALALKNRESVDLCQFASTSMQFSVPKGGSTLKLTKTVMDAVGQVGHGTEMARAVGERYQSHDRVILLSDMQAFGGYWGGNVASSVPSNVPVYAFNLSAYSASPMPTGTAARFDLGGLTDATFALIPRLEAGASGAWPWEIEAT